MHGIQNITSDKTGFLIEGVWLDKDSSFGPVDLDSIFVEVRQPPSNLKSEQHIKCIVMQEGGGEILQYSVEVWQELIRDVQPRGVMESGVEVKFPLVLFRMVLH